MPGKCSKWNVLAVRHAQEIVHCLCSGRYGYRDSIDDGSSTSSVGLGHAQPCCSECSSTQTGGAVGMPMPRSASSSTPWETASSQGPACDVRHVKLHIGHCFSCTGSSSYLVSHFTRERSCTSFCPPQPGEVGDRFGSPCHTLEVARCLRILE